MHRWDSGNLIVLWTPVGPFAMNQYLIADRASGAAAIIDPGAGPEAFVAAAAQHGLRIEQILLTHAHIDHVAGLAATHRALPLSIAMHPADLPLLAAVTMQGRMFGVAVEEPPKPDRELQDGQRIMLGGLVLDVLHTPGHAPGHVCFLEASHGAMIGGDLLFRGSIGRTDLPGADPAAMRRSLARVMTLDDSVRVFPGHMGDTTIGAERRTNPFLDDLD
jgi:glyoxylase-like metal-dependent hydrolase (beta-lactamase superfamily II)